MKVKGISLIASLFCWLSCTDSNIVEDEITPEQSTVSAQINDWVYKQMSDYYLWYDQLPEKSSLNLEQEPSDFFYGLLAEGDGKNGALYSRIKYDESLTRASASDGTLSYGFEYLLGRISGTSHLFAQVLYVQKNSPAMQAGLKRGDLILSVNGTDLTESNYYDYLSAPVSEARFSLGKVVSEHEYTPTDEIMIPAPRVVEEHAVYKDTILQIQGKKIAYLMYNSFDEAADSELCAAFRRFQAADPDEFILDLRYNPGGNVACAQLLATMLVPQTLLGEEFIHLQYNDKLDLRQDILFDASLLTQNENLNMGRIYIIASAQSASASEAVINGLRPYLGDNLIQVGETTFGKNVGQVLLENEKWPSLELWPTAFYVFNSADFGDYESGLKPDISYSEGLLIGEIGTAEDPLLAVTLEAISGRGYKGYSTRATVSSYEKICSSVSQRRPLCYIHKISLSD